MIKSKTIEKFQDLNNDIFSLLLFMFFIFFGIGYFPIPLLVINTIFLIYYLYLYYGAKSEGNFLVVIFLFPLMIISSILEIILLLVISLKK